MITDRLLGVGGFGKVYMAVNEFQRRQLACKVVDLRKLRPRARARVACKEQYAQAEDVDNRVQLRKLTALANEKRKENLLEDKLMLWYREVDILASIDHVSIFSGFLSVCSLFYSRISSASRKSSSQTTPCKHSFHQWHTRS